MDVAVTLLLSLMWSREPHLPSVFFSFFYCDSLSHELKEEPIDFPIAEICNLILQICLECTALSIDRTTAQKKKEKRKKSKADAHRRKGKEQNDNTKNRGEASLVVSAVVSGSGCKFYIIPPENVCWLLAMTQMNYRKHNTASKRTSRRIRKKHNPIMFQLL